MPVTEKPCSNNLRVIRLTNKLLALLSITRPQARLCGPGLDTDPWLKALGAGLHLPGLEEPFPNSQALARPAEATQHSSKIAIALGHSNVTFCFVLSPKCQIPEQLERHRFVLWINCFLGGCV